MLSKFAALQLQSVIGELFSLIAEQGWNPKTGSVWEIPPVGVRQTKQPNAQKIQVTVTDIEPEEEGTNGGREESDAGD